MLSRFGLPVRKWIFYCNKTWWDTCSLSKSLNKRLDGSKIYLEVLKAHFWLLLRYSKPENQNLSLNLIGKFWKTHPESLQNFSFRGQSQTVILENSSNKNGFGNLRAKDVDSYLYIYLMNVCRIWTSVRAGQSGFNNRWPDTVTWLKTSPLKGRAKSEQLSDKIPDMLIFILLSLWNHPPFDPSTSTGQDKLLLSRAQNASDCWYYVRR